MGGNNNKLQIMIKRLAIDREYFYFMKRLGVKHCKMYYIEEF